MWIKSLTVHDFRAFQKEFHMDLGRYITAIGGLNGIGKSTLLAILTNGSELKLKDGKLLNGAQFKGDFRDIVMYDPINDTTGDKATIEYTDLPEHADSPYVKKLTFRATVQHATTNKNSFILDKKTGQYVKKTVKKQNDRYRLIPKTIKGYWDSSSKIKWPSYYLGLSRIYPIGETERATKHELPADVSQRIIKKHADILSEKFYQNDSEYNKTKFQNLNISNVTKSKSGIETETYGATSNSSGQDNVGQILLTLLSFETLKDELGDNYYGGILAIDELDATLHPAAQNKLFDWLFVRSKQLNLQIIFTTHSLSLLEHISKKISEPGVEPNEVKISYLSSNSDIPGVVREHIDPVPEYFRNNLMETYSRESFNSRVNAIMEDDIGRWFLNLIIEHSDYTSLQRIYFPKVHISWNHLINLLTSAPEQFRTLLFILDPDLNTTNGNRELQNCLQKNFSSSVPNNPKGNLFILPGNDSIEKMLWKYVSKMKSDNPFFNIAFIENSGWTHDIVIKEGIESDKYRNDKNKYKHWFEDNHQFMDELARSWIIDHKTEVTQFTKILNQAFHKINSTLSKTI